MKRIFNETNYIAAVLCMLLALATATVHYQNSHTPVCAISAQIQSIAGITNRSADIVLDSGEIRTVALSPMKLGDKFCLQYK